MALWRFYRNAGGASAVEYGILIGFIAVVIATAVAAFGNTVNNCFNATRGIFG
jgi:Flp pilus assembly pilin Flp